MSFAKTAVLLALLAVASASRDLQQGELEERKRDGCVYFLA